MTPSLDTLNKETFGQAVFAAFDYGCPEQRALARALATCLRRHGADGQTIASCLRVSSMELFDQARASAFDRRLLSRDAVGLLIRLFALNVPLDEGEAANLLGRPLLAFLVDIGVLVRRPRTKVQSVVSLFWCGDKLLATDSWSYGAVWSGQRRLPDRVMYVGHDSMGLTRVAPRMESTRTLDLCCGCGIQGIVASEYSREVIAADCNPRALRFARFNAALNAVDRIDFVLGDLYAPVAGQRFSAILANPPFVATPPDTVAPLLFRDGGSDGERILSAILSGAPMHSTDNGVLSIVTDLFNIDDLPARLHAWQGTSLLSLMFVEEEIDRLDYVERHCATLEPPARDAAAPRWLAHLDEVGIRTIHFGYLVQPGAAGAVCRHDLPGPVMKSVEADVRRVIADKTHHPTQSANAVAVLAPGLRIVRRHWEKGGEEHADVIIESDSGFFPAHALSAPAYLLLDRLLTDRLPLRNIVDPDERALLAEFIDLNVLTTITAPA